MRSFPLGVWNGVGPLASGSSLERTPGQLDDSAASQALTIVNQHPIAQSRLQSGQ
jgi:hypothetical protein